MFEPAPTDVSVSWVSDRTRFAVDHATDDYRHCTDSSWYRSSLWRFMDFRRRAKRTSGRRAACVVTTGLTAADVVADTDRRHQL